VIRFGLRVRRSHHATGEQGWHRPPVIIAVTALLVLGVVPAVGFAVTQAHATPKRLAPPHPIVTPIVEGSGSTNSYCMNPTPATTSITSDPVTSVTTGQVPHTCAVSGSPALVTDAAVLGQWNPPLSGSKWVGPTAKAASSSSASPATPDWYVYDAEFSLSCPSATLNGSAWADDAVGVFLNGQLLNSGAVGALVGNPSLDFSATAGFKSGTNIVDFVVEDAGGVTGLDFSFSVDPNCGTLKICKVAGNGVPLNSHFTFGIVIPPPDPQGSPGFAKAVVPAGPAPGGYCELAGTFPGGSSLGISEVVPAGDQVTSISTNAPVFSTSNASAGLSVTIGTGVTEVTFTDATTDSGFLEICKKLPPTVKPTTTLFHFTATGGASTSIPAGACSPAINVPAGNVVVTETLNNSFPMTGCSTIPISALIPGSCHTATGKATVTVAAGDISSETILTISDR
jgi:hypothetical protein